jgi:putative transcriptional regulator
MTRPEKDRQMNDSTNIDRIMRGLNEVADIVEGKARPARVHAPADVDVKAIRTREGLSQDAFAAKYGFASSTLRQWEQGRRRPEASARLLLKVIERRPDAVQDVLAHG